MSVPKRTVRLAAAALQDYDDILVYGLMTWGESRTQQYRAALDEALAELADFPEIGIRRDEQFPGHRSRLVERHVIYYRYSRDQDERIEVVRILHERANPTRHLQD